tara:strand:- start:240 stop:578 length:339 start_codon:yes stop_codon:yes gene_type:complete
MKIFLDTIKMVSMKNRNITKIKKSDLAIPTWAIFNPKKTIKDKTLDLIKKLPPNYEFYCELVHKELIKDKDFTNTDIRRTREALQFFHEKDVLGHNGFTVINDRKVKLYFRK